MNWYELMETHAKQWTDYANNYERSLLKLDADKKNTLEALNLTQIPPALQEKFKTDYQAWQEEWGNDGRKSRMIRGIQQRERGDYFQRQEKLQAIEGGYKAPEKTPELTH